MTHQSNLHALYLARLFEGAGQNLGAAAELRRLCKENEELKAQIELYKKMVSADDTISNPTV